MKLSRNTSNFILIWLAGCIIVFSAHQFLPPRYFFDSQTIIDGLESLEYLTYFGYSFSYQNTVNLYSLLPFPTGSPLLAGLGLYCSSMFMTWIVVRSDIKLAGVLTLGMVSAATAILAIYVGQFSKEFFSIAYICFILGVSRKFTSSIAPSILAIAIATVLMSIYLRNYYAITFLLFFGLSFVAFRTSSTLLVLAATFIALVIGSILFEFFSGQYFSDLRVSLNSFREGDSDAKTQIRNSIPVSSNILDALNIIVTLVRLSVPVELLFFSSPVYYLFAAYQLGVTLIMVVALRNVLQSNITSANEWLASAFPALWAWSYVITLAIFEPDFGSFVKHCCGLYPIILMLSSKVLRRGGL